MQETSTTLSVETAVHPHQHTYASTLPDYDASYLKAKEFFERVQRPCCPQMFPGYEPRNVYIRNVVGEHTVPDPALPFWWTEGILNSKQLQTLPWLRELLCKVTWREMMEGMIDSISFKEARQNWDAEQRKLISSPKIGGMLNILFVNEPLEVLRYRNRRPDADHLPLWWFYLAMLSISYTGMSTARFLAQTSLQEYNSGHFHSERLLKFCTQTKRKPPKSEGIETFLRNTFSEFPQVITRFNQRGARANFVMRVTDDPYSIVTMSSRSPHWTSCQNPIQNDTHEMSHRLWANLLDPNMALMEMVDPTLDESVNLVARAILRVVHDSKRDLLYLDCLYGERGYITSFVSLNRKLADIAGLPPVSGRMIPFYTSFSTSLQSDPVNFSCYEPPYLDFGEWRHHGQTTHFSGQGYYILDATH